MIKKIFTNSMMTVTSFLLSIWVIGIIFVFITAVPNVPACKWPIIVYAFTWPIWSVIPDHLGLDIINWSVDFCK